MVVGFCCSYCLGQRTDDIRHSFMLTQKDTVEEVEEREMGV